jgi:thiamine-phosphate pyrophosphorylase
MSLNLSKPILYLITRGATTEATTREASEFAEVLAQVSAAVTAGIDLIQIREKRLPARVLFALTERAVKITRGTATRLLVNDRADVAAATGADGVHLTTYSLDAAVVRRSFGERFLLGASTHTRDEAYRACDQGADFIVFGPVFPTPSKDRFGQPVGLSKLHELTAELGQFPVLALGGISISNAGACFAAGANGIAGISLFQQLEQLTEIAATIRNLAKGESK